MPVRIAVDMDRCQGYRQCCLSVPQVFRQGEGKAKYTAEAEDELHAAIEAAAASCPTKAITVESGTYSTAHIEWPTIGAWTAIDRRSRRGPSRSGSTSALSSVLSCWLHLALPGSTWSTVV
ncbi:MAG: ferredoxin [Candidatus Nanopelagicales bacterium]